MREVDVCRVQAPTLPKGEHVHPLVGQRILVISHPQLKGYYAHVKDFGPSGVLVEVEAQITQNSGRQYIQPANISIMYELLFFSLFLPYF